MKQTNCVLFFRAITCTDSKMPKTKPQKPSKTLEQRQGEVQEIKTKLSELGLSTEMPAIMEIYNIMDDFASTGDSRTENIKLPGLKRIARLKLANRPQSESTMCLAYDENV